MSEEEFNSMVSEVIAKHNPELRIIDIEYINHPNLLGRVFAFNSRRRRAYRYFFDNRGSFSVMALTEIIDDQKEFAIKDYMTRSK